MSSNVPRLTGGILFGLILEARNTRRRVRSTRVRGVVTDKSDGLNEDDMMLSFIENFTGESLLKVKGHHLKRMCLNIKNV